MLKLSTQLSLLVLFTFSCTNKISEEKLIQRIPEKYKSDAAVAVKSSAENRTEIQTAIQKCPKNQLEALGFLLANMPERDLKYLSSKFILNNINLAYQAMDSVKWADFIPDEIFLNYILPYVNLHERRDDWRPDYFKRFLPLIKDVDTPGEATITLNDTIWDMVDVHYSTKRAKADQSPYESMESGLASCTGLSIILIDACRAVGIPARFVGVPLWTDHSGNHSWVEIWDNGWHFIGAAESSPLDKTWFGERAQTSNDTEWKYSIYAASFKKTDVIFPPLFDSTATYVYANIVTDRYSREVREDNHINLAIRLFKEKKGPRIEGKITVSKDGEKIDEGFTRDERRDFNDFLIFKLLPENQYQLQIEADGINRNQTITTNSDKYQFLELTAME
jgi:hypothetical protein